jgi:hypothetical protein
MRFTSPDPAASPFYNLFAYCGNSPASGYDPDGLEKEGYGLADLINDGLDIVQGVLMKVYGGGGSVVASGVQMSEGTNARDTFVGQQAAEMGDRYDARLKANGGGALGHLSGLGGTVNDSLGVTSVSESITGHDNITGAELSFKERKERFKDGLSSGLAMAIPTPPALKIVSRVASAGTRMAMKAMGRVGSVAKQACATLGRSLRALDRAISPRGVSVRGLHASRRGAVYIPGWKDIKEGFQRLILRRPDRHHLFPQEFRAWFEARGVKIDKYTYEMGAAEHSAIHSAGYNGKWLDFINEEASRASPYSSRDILRKGVRMKRAFDFDGPHVPYHD